MRKSKWRRRSANGTTQTASPRRTTTTRGRPSSWAPAKRRTSRSSAPSSRTACSWILTPWYCNCGGSWPWRGSRLNWSASGGLVRLWKTEVLPGYAGMGRHRLERRPLVLKSQRRFAPFAALAVVLIPALIPALTPAALRADEAAAFARRIREAVNPQFEGEQFGDGTITRIMEDRYVSTFEPQTFNQSMNNDNEGGIVLRPEAQQPLKVLHLKRATFTIDDTADVRSVIFQLDADSNQEGLGVYPEIFP